VGRPFQESGTSPQQEQEQDKDKYSRVILKTDISSRVLMTYSISLRGEAKIKA
jgi:hypothetical protein